METSSKRTQKELVRTYVVSNPGKTADEIAKAIGVRGANVSSVLVKGFYAGMFRREKPEGSRGWIYFIVVST